MRAYAMKTVTTYSLASALVTILAITLFGFYSLDRYHDYEVNEENVRLETCIRTFWHLLSKKGTDFRIVDGKLMAGSYPVNGNFELPDKIQEIFGGVATIFMGDVRVTTNVLGANGERAVGTRLTGPAYDALFKQGKSYRGAAAILGVPYLTAYDPIRNQAGKIIGVLFVGVKESDFLARLHVLKLHLTLTLVGLVIVVALVMVLLGRAMKRVEDTNANQLRFQETLINTIPSPVFYKDTACRYLGCNKAFEAYVGYSRNELIGKMPNDIWPQEIADRYLHHDRALLENPGMQSYEAAVRYADGSLRNVIFNKATFEGKDGAVAGLIGVILDITERKAAEEALKDAYQQLFDIIDFLPDATFVLDLNRKVIAWNRAIEKMTGVLKEDILGQGDYVYSIPFYGERRPILIDLLDEDPESLDNYSSVRREGNTLFAEAVIPDFQQKLGGRHLWGTATPLFDANDKRVGTIESIRDITEQKRAEQKRSFLEAQLQHSRMMETFMLRLGHDLRTPLTPLFVLFPLISEKVTDPQLRRIVDICSQSATTIKRLMDRAQMLVSLSAEIAPEELKCVHLDSMLKSALADSVDSMALKHLACRNDVDPLIVVEAVPYQIKELFEKLISNAIRFSPVNGVIRVTAEQRAGSVTVDVHDDGIGLDSDHLERIFDEFFKADESRHDLDTPGLGLAICRRIVLNHHGRIWAESPGIGMGTTIRFTVNQKWG